MQICSQTNERITRIKMNHNFHIIKSDVPFDDSLLRAQKSVYHSALHNVIFMRNVPRRAVRSRLVAG
jgi:hypothetical protein